MSNVELLIMAAIDGGERYGRDIQAEVARLNDGRKLAVGSLYTTLERMEGKQLVVSRWGNEKSLGARRRYYTLTPQALAILQTHRTLVNQALGKHR